MIATRLRTEYLTNPMGIDLAAPRLFWNCEGGTTQTAYQIIAQRDETLVWDTGKVLSRRMANIPWGAQALHSKDIVRWQVRLWDEHDVPGDWSAAQFEMGLLHQQDWKAKWISGDYIPQRKQRHPVDCFQKRFDTTGFVKARLYITACGVYEATLNGLRVGDFILAPGITDYKKRIQYQVYDVTELVQSAGNTLTISLADGWYRGSCGAWGMRNQYGTVTKLIAQLELTCADGHLTTIGTDESWGWSNDGAIRFADNKDGEIVDARKTPSYSNRAKVTSCAVTPSASNNVPVVEKERFAAKAITTPAGKTVLDFGQNIAGYVEFTLTARAGQKIHLRFGEMLDENGEFTQKNIQCSNKKITSPLQQVIYTCKDGENYYKPKFAIFGFQYVLIETDVVFDQADVTAIAVYSDMEQTLRFDSSNELLNRFVEATIWSTKGNSADLPTDCPTRERHGWTGDAQIFFNTAGYLLDYATFARKYVRDMNDWQRKDGCYPQIVPSGGVDFYMNSMNGSVGWSDAGVLIPYRFWKLYGDSGMIRENYDAMRRYAQFMERRLRKWTPLSKRVPVSPEHKKYIANYGQSYGEWAEPADVHKNVGMDIVFPRPEESTAYTAYIMTLMAEIASALGKEADAKEYLETARGCRNAYQRLRELPDYTLDTDRQARLVRPLYFDLLDDAQTEYAKKRLVQALENYGWRLGTGFLSTPLILDVLSDIDIEYAYKLLENEEMPGWLFMPKMNAGTVWESWEGTQAQSGIASLNHYSKGAVCEWLFRVMCGIAISGENSFAIAPRPGGHFTHAFTAYDSIYGTVESGWIREKDKTVYTITIPSNCTGTVTLPSGKIQTVAHGKHLLEEVRNEK